MKQEAAITPNRPVLGYKPGVLCTEDRTLYIDAIALARDGSP